MKGENEPGGGEESCRRLSAEERETIGFLLFTKWRTMEREILGIEQGVLAL